MKYLLFIPFLILLSTQIHGQGKLLLVGGGSESNNGWSDDPYRWMVDQAENKRIAIISSTAGNDPEWLVNYFVSLGATRARNFEFSARVTEDADGIYDSLMTYDAFFFKGGDQWIYYLYFNNTDVEKAIVDKFAQGGVMGGTSAGMAILGQYTYTAEKSSLTPFEGLENVFNENITIADDFAPLLSGYITDTHFLERGRLPRLNSMQANYFLKNDIEIKGIACDDQTAIAIDENNIGTVYGNGGAYIYIPSEISAEDDKWTGSHRAIHLSQGMRVNLISTEIEEGPKTSSQAVVEESTNNNILLCGSNWIDQNSPCVQAIAAQEDTLIIITGASRLTAATLLQALSALGKKDALVLSATSDNNDESLWKLRNTIRRSKNLVFIENNFEGLNDFLNNGPTGQLLKSHMHRDHVYSAFFGQDCKLAGKMYCENNLSEPNLAFNGQLVYKEGLGLLANSIVTPEAFEQGRENFYENNTLNGLYALSANDLAYAMYPGSNSWVSLFQQEDNNYLKADGRFGTVVVKNTSDFHEAFTVKAGVNPRNNASFDQLEIYVLNNENHISVGQTLLKEDPDYEYESAPETIITSIEPTETDYLIYPTITESTVNVYVHDDCIFRLIKSSGVLAKEIELGQGDHIVDINGKGVFIIQLIRKSDQIVVNSQKIVKF